MTWLNLKWNRNRLKLTISTKSDFEYYPKLLFSKMQASAAKSNIDASFKMFGFTPLMSTNEPKISPKYTT